MLQSKQHAHVPCLHDKTFYVRENGCITQVDADADDDDADDDDDAAADDDDDDDDDDAYLLRL